MRIIALLIALFLLLVFGLDIIFSNFLYLSFHWSDLLFYALVALIIYILLSIVGNSLNKKFEDSINSFLKKDSKVINVKKSYIRTYGLLLIILLPYLLFILALGLFAAIDFGVYMWILFSYLGRIPIILPIGLIIIIVGTCIGVIVGIFYLLFPPRRKFNGIELAAEEKNIWEITKVVADDLKTNAVDRIILTPNSGVGVYADGSFIKTIFGGGTKTLVIGFSSVRNLTISEFKSILAHEYGHFTNKDTQWLPYTYAMGSSLSRTLHSIPGPSKSSDGNTSKLEALLSLNPAHWLLSLYTKFYMRITNSFSRLGEVKADLNSIQIYGGETFSKALVKVYTNGTVFSRLVEKPYLLDFLKNKKTISKFSDLSELYLEKTTENDIKQIQEEIITKHSKYSVYDSHPSLRIRLEYAKKFNNKKTDKEEKYVDSLFIKSEDIDKNLGDLYNSRLLGYLQSRISTPKTKRI